jgi:hypothetical protein
VRIGNPAFDDETSISIRFAKERTHETVGAASAFLSLVASIAAGLASCESTPTVQDLPLAQTRGKSLYQHDCIGYHAQQASSLQGVNDDSNRPPP